MSPTRPFASSSGDRPRALRPGRHRRSTTWLDRVRAAVREGAGELVDSLRPAPALIPVPVDVRPAGRNRRGGGHR